MTQWQTPERLDRVSASGEPDRVAQRASSVEVGQALDKALITGGLRRIPKNPRHRDLVLAVLCLRLRRRYPYSEPEINQRLGDALDAMNARVDHVTCRRYLVDLGFLKRDRAGVRYFLNYPRLEATLSPGAIEAAPGLVQDALQRRA